MVKIFITVRNRLAITKKCIEAIRLHSTLPRQIYIFDNQTNYLVDEHFQFYADLYKNGEVSQITFNTDQSTFGAFSKAVSCNMFALLHEQAVNNDNFQFLLILDNDIILTPGWDQVLLNAWKYVNKKAMKNIKVIGQAPGGIKRKVDVPEKVSGFDAFTGYLGGSGLWSVRPNFFRDVGILDLKTLVGYDKRHDQMYWNLLSKKTDGEPYIMGLRTKLGIHCGKYAGSVCNRLTKNRLNPNKSDLVKFEEAEKKIDDMDFATFYKTIVDDKILHEDW
jgi:hypothetical protein